ncbi:MAG TPA: hypothetical protein VFK05_20905 [Polyangiaceae bacterium]|nr:hypothetical protein [Polyangiaceae bacterium]
MKCASVKRMVRKEERDGAVASGTDQGLEAGYQRLDVLLDQSWSGTLPH